eukprot:CAMPEP_0170184172 /NCGR_PEP_ID=MMETSP0040_2-20121228/32869_1 /TAXON_ID=641309 /ORGANISM="Lotharella oceanica, Strain CCMP622" /LENGTH=357 /DNA_ID=CAMNT_0010430135 /DNA_START=19 /DNA_END=1092 /DNA_ORIENTATION=-
MANQDKKDAVTDWMELSDSESDGSPKKGSSPEPDAKKAKPGPGQSDGKKKGSEEDLPLAVFIEFVGDRSGSMDSMGSGPTEQTYQLIHDQRKTALETGVPTFFSLTTFDGSAEVRFENVNIAEFDVPSLKSIREWLEPRGTTRLIDTALERLEAQRRSVAAYLSGLKGKKKQERSGKVVRQFALLTDGQDNASQNSPGKLRRVITRAQQNEDLATFFLAANQDAIETGKSYGFTEDTSITFGANHQHSKKCIGITSKYMSGRGRSVSYRHAYTPVDRASSYRPQTTTTPAHLAYHTTAPAYPTTAPALPRSRGGRRGHLQTPASPMKRGAQKANFCQGRARASGFRGRGRGGGRGRY